jgi:DNA-directed RNA polymerase subunit RPC12/RpoP
VTITKYRCQSCGCEFQQIEHWEVETEVTSHGKEAES